MANLMPNINCPATEPWELQNAPEAEEGVHLIAVPHACGVWVVTRLGFAHKTTLMWDSAGLSTLGVILSLPLRPSGSKGLGIEGEGDV